MASSDLHASEVRTKKINNMVVNKVEFIKPSDTRPVLGADLFPELCCNIFECAKKHSGKSTTTFSIIKKCASKETKVIVFCSSLNNDKCWLAIQKYCEDKGIQFEGHTSIFDEDGDNLVEGLVNRWRSLKEGAEGEEAMGEGDDRMGEQEGEGSSVSRDPMPVLQFVHTDESELEETSEKPKKKRKSKFQSPDYLIIFDDVSVELKNKWVTALVKIHRHYKSKIILSSQSVVDLAPGARNQMDYTLIYGGMPEDKIEKILICCSLPITLRQLMKMYKVATKEKYSFLYIDAVNNKYRMNFNTEIEIPQD